MLGNPHSEHGPSRAATDDVERARRAILDYLHADPAEYAVVLTTNATAACRLVAESFPFRAGSVLALAADNHNSVNGIREYARARGAGLATIPLDDELRLAEPLAVLDAPGAAPSLFAFPAQSNFSGAGTRCRSSPTRARAAGACCWTPRATCRPRSCDSTKCARTSWRSRCTRSPVIRPGSARSSRGTRRSPSCERPSFAGGTVQWVSVQREAPPARRRRRRIRGWHRSLPRGGRRARRARDRGERGTGPPRAPPAHAHGELLFGLQSLRHRNGAPVVRIHGPRTMEARGATIAMSILTPAGAALPYWEVEERRARAPARAPRRMLLQSWLLRARLRLRADQAAACLDELGEDFTIPKFADCLGGGTVGAVRLSLGLGTVRDDVRRALEFVERYAA